MKTSKEMQLKIIDKMRENVESDKLFYEDLEYRAIVGRWESEHGGVMMDKLEYRIKPQTITINGVEIKKPISSGEIKDNVDYFFVENDKDLYGCGSGRFIISNGIRFVYSSRAEAIEASKLLFGIKD